MAVPFSNTKLRVPRGFQNVLEGLSREVLRSQPKDIYQFGAVYFENLLKIREETGNDPTTTGAMLEDRFYNNDSFKQQSLDPSDPQQQEAALLIQTQYRQHAAERQLEKKKEEEAAVKIQAQYRGHHDRQKVEEMTASGEQQQPQQSQQQQEEVDIDLNDPEVANAAVKIQAGFKGYKARKEVHEMKGKDAAPAAAEAAQGEPAAADAANNKDDDLDIDLTDPELNEAATKIQASFRGLQARKDVKEMKMADEVSKNEADAAVKIQAGIRGHLARKQVQHMKEPKPPTPPPEEEVDIDLTDPEVEKAAIKIQAGFKGFKQRKKFSADEGKEEQAGGEDKKSEQQEEKKESGATAEEEEVDIDLNDPATEAAALKIQASFRGHKTREELKHARTSEPSEPEGGEATAAPAEEASGGDQEAKAGGGEEEVVDIDLNDPEVEQAAVKIQAGFKGYKARKEVQSKKEEEEEGGNQE